jgi:hypothetical protein
MTLTRKHFEAIAKVMREHHPGEVTYTGGRTLPSSMADRERLAHEAQLWRGIVRSLADMCAESNTPQFQSGKFMSACYPGKNDAR